MIKSADEFIRLRTSEDPNEYHRSAWEEASVQVWQEVIAKYPDMREWVAHNKTIPVEVIAILAQDDSATVRHTIASKGKTPSNVLMRLAQDSDEGVRMAVARHPKAPREALERLAGDDWEEIRKIAIGRLGDRAPRCSGA